MAKGGSGGGFGGPSFGGGGRGGVAVGIGAGSKLGGPISFGGGPERGGGLSGFSNHISTFAPDVGGRIAKGFNPTGFKPFTFGGSINPDRPAMSLLGSEFRPLSAPRAQIGRAKVPEVFYKAFTGKNLDPNIRPTRTTVPDVFHRSLANINLDPTKPARHTVPSVFQNAFDQLRLEPIVKAPIGEPQVVSPKIEQTKPLVQTEVVKKAEVILRVTGQSDIKTKVIQTRRVVEAANIARAPNIAEAALSALPLAVAAQLRQELSEIYPHALPKTETVVATTPSLVPEKKMASKAVALEIVKEKRKKLQSKSKEKVKTGRIIVDKPVNQLRQEALNSEIYKLAQKDDGSINFKEVVQVLLSNNSEFNSGINKKGPDGSKDGLIDTLKSEGIVGSVAEAQSKVHHGIKANNGVDVGLEGESATLQEAKKVLTPKNALAEEEDIVSIILRKIGEDLFGKKQVQVGGGEVKVITIEDNSQEQDESLEVKTEPLQVQAPIEGIKKNIIPLPNIGTIKLPILDRAFPKG